MAVFNLRGVFLVFFTPNPIAKAGVNQRKSNQHKHVLCVTTTTGWFPWIQDYRYCYDAFFPGRISMPDLVKIS